jgi:uncharacterized protein (TIGR03083 family)
MALDHLAVIAADSERIADLASRADLTRPVPSCPGWSMRDLVDHIGEVQRFWAENVRAADPGSPWQGDRLGYDETDPAGWMRGSTTSLLDALGDAGDEAPSWTWWGDPLTAGAVKRHQVQEAAVHRWDAEAALGTPNPLDADAAHDGVGEFLEVMLGDDAGSLPGTVALVSSDTSGRWLVGNGEHADAEITGAASDLVLLLYRRVDSHELGVTGDRDVVASFLAAASTE